ncbi:MAG: chloride channel protein [Muribaculaceae bacterium]
MRYPRTTIRAVHHLRGWRRRNISRYSVMFILAVAVGFVTGMCAVLLKKGIALVSHLVTAGVTMAHENWQLLVFPVIGIVLTGIFVRYVVRLDITKGTNKMLKQLKVHDYVIRARVMVSPMIGAMLTLGFGGSAGSEGPIAYTGGAIGSNAARLFGLRPELQRVLLGCGAAAGIAGIFKSPIGGFLFALEVLRISMTTSAVVALLTASVTAGATAYVMSGYTFDMAFAGTHVYQSHLLPWYCLLGIVCGLYGYYYSHVMDRMDRGFRRISNPWLRNVIGGGILALCVFSFPALYGEGYGVMAQILGGDVTKLVEGSIFRDFGGLWLTVGAAAAICLVKPFACSSTNSSGGVAGDFAPTLFAGCMVGLLYALVLNYWGIDIPLTDFAYLGMGAVMAGAIRAPLMALFIVLEMTATFTLFWPMLIVTALSYFVVRLCTPDDFYTLRPRPRYYPGTDK